MNKWSNKTLRSNHQGMSQVLSAHKTLSDNLSNLFTYGDEIVINTKANFNTNVPESQWNCSASDLRAFRDLKKAYHSVGLIEVL
jgi:hypothetical protein